MKYTIYIHLFFYLYKTTDQDLDGRTDYVDYSTYVGPRHDYDKSDYNKHLDYGTVVGPGDLRYKN